MNFMVFKGIKFRANIRNVFQQTLASDIIGRLFSVGIVHVLFN